MLVYPNLKKKQILLYFRDRRSQRLQIWQKPLGFTKIHDKIPRKKVGVALV